MLGINDKIVAFQYSRVVEDPQLANVSTTFLNYTVVWKMAILVAV
jgi:hypothetical protein